MIDNPVLTLVLGWFGAVAATWIVTATSLFAWYRLPHQARYQKRARELLSGTIDRLSPDDPRRWKAGRRYEILTAWADAPGCRQCVGFWMFALAALTSWLQLGAPGTLWGVQSWFAMPAFALGGWWVFVILAQWLEPPSSTAPVTVIRN